MQIVSLQPVIEKWNELSDEYVNLYPLVTSLLLMIALIVIFYVINPRFLSARNIRIILAQSATYLILAVGMTLVITSSGIDISIGSMVALIAIVTGFVLVKYSLPIWLGILVLLGMGLLCGLFNAVFISAFKIPAI
ncbi:ABC transporter permease, partial [Candidatus Aerophobetes bacterium]|nr:ABC transporter permease [Candidatus Aerophobetes bacterium]